ncbi:MAG: hypothetical protein DCC58_02415 [Chloroflexi bacterium]|nr:MAG: hypothetical protein DCC58_02415 [Chloroflexota bacterium]
MGSTYPATQPASTLGQFVVRAAATLAPDERVGRAQRPAQRDSSRKLFAAGITVLGIALVIATAYYVRRKRDGDE